MVLRLGVNAGYVLRPDVDGRQWSSDPSMVGSVPSVVR